MPIRNLRVYHRIHLEQLASFLHSEDTYIVALKDLYGSLDE